MSLNGGAGPEQSPPESKPSANKTINFKERIHGHEHDLTEELPNLDYLQ